MAEQMRTELMFLRRDIRKYLLANLDPGLALALPNSHAITTAMARVVTAHMVQVHHDPTGLNSKGRFPLRIHVDFPEHFTLSTEAHKELERDVQRHYVEEFCSAVDQMYFTLKMPLEKAIITFRNLYDINEDDYALVNSFRCYERHRRRNGHRSKRGRKPKVFEMLKDPRTRDMHPGRTRLSGDQDAPEA